MTTETAVYFVARERSQFHQRDADILGPVLQRMSAEGRNTASATVAEAEANPESPLRPYFEWDDTMAAHKHRMKQARDIWGGILVRTLVRAEVRDIRAFVAVTCREDRESASAEKGPEKEPERRYVSIQTARERPEFRVQVKRDALTALLGWKERYRTYREVFEEFGEIFAPVFDAIEVAEDRMLEA